MRTWLRRAGFIIGDSAWVIWHRYLVRDEES